MEVWLAKALVMVLLTCVVFVGGLLPVRLIRNIVRPRFDADCDVDHQGPSVSSGRRRSRRRFILDVVNCFAGGVFLATTLLHMLPDVRRDMDNALRAIYTTAAAAAANDDNDDAAGGYPVYAKFPMAEFITCIGFFVVLLLEEILVQCHSGCGSATVTKPPAANRNNSKLRPIMLQPTASKSNAAALRLSEELQATAASSHREYGATSFIAHHGDQPPDELSCATKDRKHIHRVFQKLDIGLPKKDSESPEMRSQRRALSLPLLSSPNVFHNNEVQVADSTTTTTTTDDSLSTVRSLVLLLALSVHMVFEGLAIGMQTTAAEVWILFAAVSFHKAVMSFTSGVRFTESLSSTRQVLLSISFLAFASPLGVAIGLTVTSMEGQDGGVGPALTGAILQGLAAGTFVYVTFFEVLNEHLATIHSEHTEDQDHHHHYRHRHGGGHDGKRLLQIAALLVGFGCIALLEMIALKLTTGK